jgi:peptidyl-prolyl cis-trans isomerase A (cyclophilin A)
VDCVTTKGNFTIQLESKWSPLGVDRFLKVVDGGFYNNVPLFRCVDNFLCQFGYTSNKKIPELEATFPDDNVPRPKFKQGYVSFAGYGKDSRSVHLFITLGKNVDSLGSELHETPIGYVTPETFASTVSKWYTGYGDMYPFASGPDPHRIEKDATYLPSNFPLLDYILSCKVRKTNEKEAL